MNLTISKKIKYLYWFFTIGIVIFHSWIPTEFELVTVSNADALIAKLYRVFADRLGHIALTFFFFLSGFWLYNNVRTNTDVIIKIKKRIYSLLFPYLIWTAIFAVIKVLLHELTVFELLANLHIYFIFTPIIGVTWYILSLILLLLFFPILAMTNKNRAVSLFAFSAIIVYYIVTKYLETPYLITPPAKWWWYHNMRFYLPVYLLGGCIGLNYPNIIIEKEYNSKIDLVVGIIMILISGALFYLFRIRKFYALFSIIFLTGLWLTLRNTIFTKKVPKIFDAEFFLFILHQPLILPIMAILLRKILPIKTMNGFEMLIIKAVNLLSAILMSYLIRRILEKILPKKIYNLFSGGR